MEKREAKRLELLTSMFDKSDSEKEISNPSTSVKTDVKSQLRKWEKLSKKINKSWELITLKKYLEVQRVPRGLRIMLMPNHQDVTNELLQEWGDFLLKSSLGLLEILVRHIEISLNKVKEELLDLEKELSLLKLSTESAKYKNELEGYIEKHEEIVRQRKQTKFARDAGDYAEGRIFTFARKYDSFTEDTS